MPSSTALAHGAPDRSNAASGDASSDDSEDDDIDALLMQACSAGSEDVASTLLRHGASASTRDEHALCPLHHAAWNGHTGIARLLLSHGADWRARDRRGATAAHLAAQFRHADVLALLLEAAGEVGGAKALLQSRCGLGRSVQDTVADFATAGAARPLPEGIPPGFTDQASALAWPIRRLLVDGDAPEAVSAAAVLKAMRLPWRQPDSVDGLADHQVDLTAAQLEALVGRPALEALCRLPGALAAQMAAAGGPAEGGLTEASPGGVSSLPSAGERPYRTFVRRFTPAERPWFTFHGDTATATVNVALADDGSHGGGRLLAMLGGRVQRIDRAMGEATVHPSELLHAVSRTTRGTRYSLVLFFGRGQRSQDSCDTTCEQ
ncbi:hypothetical protein EMIHUDRAFT_119520 [Emiliania huxleyi CCMP1516]|uniref:Fe2OG dioxygenase domain-containing protein n=2 Tax=Emiliania huxleyi TaxID=2903 RepID=A0A0D3IUY4_EMIH1|nr:hypothetical protein EMIHUDRAFT_119520 [Emiliania huxleyi CCMP1516]EOD15069.1 hypothetical protein EMIHUDRAFT_119520 [Emiliania huxleyi CCMP1516]|eukprot:XP_005767498.1 hypothetical protein EMIHUDRAFT_119520 [Emiliania huxleyi CCMP1516]